MNTSTSLSPSIFSTRFVSALVALILGIALFVGAGFATPSVLHSATHDTRHALGLPCH